MRWRYELVVPAVKYYKDSEIGYLYGETDNTLLIPDNILDQNKVKVASFDLDDTLINTKSGKKFAKDSNDWKWLYDNVKDTLQSYIDKGFQIIIVTNQAGIKSNNTKLNEFKQKIEFIETDINKTHPNISFKLYCAVHKDVHRKPYPTFLETMNIDRSVSFFCGDGAGRSGDHTSGDIKFAYNLMIHFKTPERLFLNDINSNGIITYPIKQLDETLINLDQISSITPNEDKKPELIIMVGLPASGKSYTVKKIIENYTMQRIHVEHISLDIIRSKPKMMNMIKSCASNGNTMIIDNTNLEVYTRDELIYTAKGLNKNYYVRIVHIDTPLDRCIHNNYYRYYKNYRTDPKLIPDFVYKSMSSRYEIPTRFDCHLIDKIDTIRPKIPLDVPYIYYYF